MTKQPFWLPSTHGGQKIFNHLDSAHRNHTGNFGRLVPKGCYVVPFGLLCFLVRDYHIQPRKELHRRFWVTIQASIFLACSGVLQMEACLSPKPESINSSFERSWQVMGPDFDLAQAEV